MQIDDSSKIVTLSCCVLPQSAEGGEMAAHAGSVQYRRCSTPALGLRKDSMTAGNMVSMFRLLFFVLNIKNIPN